MNVKEIGRGSFDSYEAAVKEWEAEVARLRRWREENTEKKETAVECLEVVENGFTTFVLPQDLNPKYREHIPEKGDLSEFEGTFGDVLMAWGQKIEEAVFVPPVEFPPEPNPDEYFAFTPREAVKFARERGFNIPPGGFHTPTAGDVPLFGRDIRPTEERYTFIHTSEVAFVEHFYRDLGEDGWMKCRLDRYTRRVLAIFRDGWEEVEVVEEMWEAVDPKPVTNVSTSIEVGFWNK